MKGGVYNRPEYCNQDCECPVCFENKHLMGDDEIYGGKRKNKTRKNKRKSTKGRKTGRNRKKTKRYS